MKQLTDRAIRRWITLFLATTAASCGLAQTGSVVTVNADQVLVLNGRKVFPIGFSPGPPTGGVTPSGGDALQELRNAGGLLFRMSQNSDWNSQMISNQQAALDWAAQHGMYVWLNLREKSKFAAGDAATEATLRSLVNQFKNHPALGLWKNFDEAWWGGVSAADLQRGYDVIKSEDTNHPVVQTHAPRGTLTDLQPYNAATDLLALDIYPIGYPPGANSLLANKEISMVGDYADFLNQVGNGQKSFWMIEQIAWSGVTNPGKTLRFPTFEQSRFMAYHAIIHGARGLMFFGGTITAALTPQDAALGWNWTFWDRVLKRVVLELGDTSPLAEALAAPDSALPITVSGATNIEFCVREVPPYLYILACAREGVTTNVTFSGLPASAGLGELLYESPRKVTATGGTFTDWFGPFEVHAYRFAVTNGTQANAWPLYEPFDYPNIGAPVSSNTPANWTFGGSGANDLNVASGGLSHPGLPSAIGNSVTNGGAGLGVRRLLGTNLNSGQVYFSALFRINNLGYGAWNGASSFAGALTAPDNTSFRCAAMVRSNSSDGYVIGLGSTGGTTVHDTMLHQAGETVLLVGKYDLTVTPNAISLWINPDPSAFGGSSEPAPTLSTVTATAGLSIDRFNLRQNTVSSVPAAMQWDELRFGSTWADVTSLPPIAPTILTDVTKLVDGVLQFSYASASPSFSVYASTNLTNWSAIGVATQVAPNLYQFTDMAATNYPKRFYQLRAN